MPKTATRLQPDDAAQGLRAAAVQPSTWNEADRSVEVVWTTGAAVARYDWWDDEIYSETLSVEESAVRLERLQQGGPVLRDHVASTTDLVGSIVPGSVRLANGVGTARVRFADTPDVADLVAKVRDGHLRSVSVGYIVHQYTRVERPGERPELRADDWEPTEISFTPVPADPGAQVRTKGTDMPQPRVLDQDGNEIPAQRSSAPYREGGPSRRREVTADQILRACSRAQIDRATERQLLEDHERKPMDEDELFDAIAAAIGNRRNQQPINQTGSRGDGPNGAARTRELFADVVAARLLGREPGEGARGYAGASLVDLGRALLEENGERMRFARANTIIDAVTRAGAHTTSDFAYMLQQAGQRFLIDTFGSVGSPLKMLARPRSLPDFKKAYGIEVSGPGGLRLVLENGEYKRVSVKEGKSSIQLQTYGDIFSISRQALINDDLGVFRDMLLFWTRAQAETEASYLTALIAGNGVVLEDGNTLYHASHGNLAGSGAAISETSLSAARAAMRAQKNQDGETFANVTPKYLVVGPAKETEAEKVLATLAPATTANANPFSGKLELVVDPRLTGNSWRLFADPATRPVLEFATLEGQDGLFTDTRVGFDVDGVEFKARIDIGAAAWDYRGTYMNPGN